MRDLFLDIKGLSCVMLSKKVVKDTINQDER